MGFEFFNKLEFDWNLRKIIKLLYMVQVGSQKYIKKYWKIELSYLACNYMNESNPNHLVNFCIFKIFVQPLYFILNFKILKYSKLGFTSFQII